jgi:hypothetical protein
MEKEIGLFLMEMLILEWVENLNSLLDNNKLLTLLKWRKISTCLKYKIYVMQLLVYCGMIWFSEEILTTKTIYENYLI